MIILLANLIIIILTYCKKRYRLIHGKDGKSGTNGKDGKNGRHGKNGDDGEDGKDGQDGKKGQDGQDKALKSSLFISLEMFAFD